MDMTLYGLAAVFIVIIALLAMLSIVYMSVRNGISPMPSSPKVIRAVTKEIGSLPRVRTIVEAGSGWGTLALHLARHRNRGAGHLNGNIIGLENSWVPLSYSRLLCKIRGESTSAIRFIQRDIYHYSYRKADVVVCYLFPRAMESLSRIFRDQLTLGTRVISICFALPGWVPDKVIVCEDMYRTKIYVYSVSVDIQ